MKVLYWALGITGFVFCWAFIMSQLMQMIFAPHLCGVVLGFITYCSGSF